MSQHLLSKAAQFFLLPLVIACLAAGGPAQAQDNGNKNNLVKVNLSALVFKNVSVQYERKIGKKISFAANVRNMAFDKLPFLGTIENIVDDPNVPVDKIRLGTFGITPELRFYLGKQALKGFYVAPFANYNRFKADLPIDYGNKTGIFNGTVTTLTGGLQLGAQFKISNAVYLDWWIIGPNYGSGKGTLTFTGQLTAMEQQELRQQIEDFRSDAPWDKIIESYTVNSNGATIRADGPWAGLRGLGINLGIRF